MDMVCNAWSVYIIIILSIYPALKGTINDREEVSLSEVILTSRQTELLNSKDFEEVVEIVYTRCNMCHAAEPYYDGIIVAPKNVILETELDTKACKADLRQFCYFPCNATCKFSIYGNE